MPVYWEQSMGGFEVEDSNTKVEDEDCDIQKPQIQSNEDEKLMEDLAVNIILIVELHMINKSMINNCTNARIGIQGFEDKLLGVLVQSTEVFT
jgi:hypothetical protein